jgi:hypothetical protein
MPLERVVQLSDYAGLAQGGPGMKWTVDLDPNGRINVRIIRIVRGETPADDGVIFAWAVEDESDDDE